jgi:ABC-2 type transport system ATP-binding protein
MKVGLIMIEISNLVRVYKSRKDKKTVTALKGIEFKVKEGELFGVLGPNGAGKTTLIRILCTLLTPSEGKVLINGIDISKKPNEVRQRIGVVFGGERGLYDRLTAGDNLRFSAELYGLDPKVTKVRISELLSKVGLEDKIDVRVETFSRGMKQKLHIVRALLHDPDILFFDEPSAGLDPVAARDLRKIIKELKATGKTIILTTHYMFEADELCDRIAVIVDGKIIKIGVPDEIKSNTQVGRTFEFDIFSNLGIELHELLKVEGILEYHSRNLDGYVRWTISTHKFSTIGKNEIANLLGLDASIIVERPTTLEDAYIALVGKH